MSKKKSRSWATVAISRQKERKKKGPTGSKKGKSKFPTVRKTQGKETRALNERNFQKTCATRLGPALNRKREGPNKLPGERKGHERERKKGHRGALPPGGKGRGPC